MPDTSFVPCLHGYDFVNDFTNFVGPITTRGLCGGMVYSALDHFSAGRAVPVTGLPPEGSPLRNFLFTRQVESLVSQGPGFVSRLASIWNDDRARFSWGVGEEHELGRLRRAVDAGRPAPLGVISVHADLFAHHQMLAIGYDTGSQIEDLRIRVYDPNHPNVVTTLVPEPRSTGSGPRTPTDRISGSIGARTSSTRATARCRRRRSPARAGASGTGGGAPAARALAYGGGEAGTCPTGGRHDHSASSDYVLFADAPQHPGQGGWKWCRRCEGLAFLGGAPGRCPSGGHHDHSHSASYVISLEEAGDAGQDGWRWCSRCQGLAYGEGGGACPSGGHHDHTASSRYQLAHA